MKVFFSVVIPTLNEEHDLPRLLDSLKAQTFNDFEVIVVDGNSEDKTKSEAVRHKPVSQFTFLTVKKRSVSFQRNYGASKAKGEYLVFIDADATLAPDFFEKIHAGAQLHQSALIFPAMNVNAGPVAKGMAQISNLYIGMARRWNISAVPVGICILRTNVFNQIGGYRGEEYQLKHMMFPEDQDIACRVRNAGFQPIYLSRARVNVSMRRFDRDGAVNTYMGYVYNMFAVAMRKYLHIAPLKAHYEQGGHVYRRRVNGD